MGWRLLQFLAVLGLGAWLGWVLLPLADAGPRILSGVALAGAFWMAVDLGRAARLLRWLRQVDLTAMPNIGGIWGEVAGRVLRQLRVSDERARTSEARLQAFLAAIQASPNGVIILDPEGRIEWCNQTAALHFGLDAQRDLGQHLTNLLRDPAYISYQAQHDYSSEVVIAGWFSTTARPVSLSIKLHRYGEGRRLLIARDVTMLEQADAVRRDFVANVSHEIRTPLTVLAGFVETMQTLPLELPDQQRYLALMAQQASRMQTLVDDLLTLSRLEGDPLPQRDQWHNTNQMLSQCEQDARDLSALLANPPHDIALVNSGPAELSGTRTEVLSAMSNLVNNAVRYTPAGSKILLQWRTLPTGQAEFSVQDTGPGIAAEHIARLTERFYRIDRSRSRETGGTGLGLAIVKHVMQRHGGSLQIESHPGRGSRFALLFPASRVRSGSGLTPHQVAPG